MRTHEMLNNRLCLISPSSPWMCGVVTFDHVLPFHCAMNALVFASKFHQPTAKQRCGAKHAMSTSPLDCEPAGRRRDAIAHVVPFHCSIRVRFPLPFPTS